jgi:hypothetical protein
MHGAIRIIGQQIVIIRFVLKHCLGEPQRNCASMNLASVFHVSTYSTTQRQCPDKDMLKDSESIFSFTQFTLGLYSLKIQFSNNPRVHIDFGFCEIIERQKNP